MTNIEITSLKVLARRNYWRVWLKNTKPSAIAARKRYADSAKGRAAQSKAGAAYYRKKKKEQEGQNNGM